MTLSLGLPLQVFEGRLGCGTQSLLDNFVLCESLEIKKAIFVTDLI